MVVQFDIIVVTETWLTAEISSILHMSGYHCINLIRNRHCGGISIYYNKNIQIELCGEGTVVFDLVEVISCNIMYLSQVIHLSCFYRPPNENIRDFIDLLNNNIFPLIPKNANSILCGDFNANLFNPLHLTLIDEFVNSLSGQGYFSLILKPTRLPLKIE